MQTHSVDISSHTPLLLKKIRTYLSPSLNINTAFLSLCTHTHFLFFKDTIISITPNPDIFERVSTPLYTYSIKIHSFHENKFTAAAANKT